MLQGSNQVISDVLRACPSVRGDIAWDWTSGFVFFRHILLHPLATPICLGDIIHANSKMCSQFFSDPLQRDRPLGDLEPTVPQLA